MIIIIIIRTCIIYTMRIDKRDPSRNAEVLRDGVPPSPGGLYNYIYIYIYIYICMYRYIYIYI